MSKTLYLNMGEFPFLAETAYGESLEYVGDSSVGAEIDCSIQIFNGATLVEEIGACTFEGITEGGTLTQPISISGKVLPAGYCLHLRMVSEWFDYVFVSPSFGDLVWEQFSASTWQLSLEIIQDGYDLILKIGYGGSKIYGIEVLGPQPGYKGHNITFPGDASDHGGTVLSDVKSSTVKAKGNFIALDGCGHSCPVTGHGTTPITATVEKSYINGKLVITKGAKAGCGAIILSPDRGVYVE